MSTMLPTQTVVKKLNYAYLSMVEYWYFSLLLMLDRPMHNARTRTSFLCYCRVTVSP
jgi:hypothetical protein